jgi:hypothetical protein
MKMTDCSLEVTENESEASARKKFYFLDDINEYARLLNLGVFPGKEYKSIQKIHSYLEQLWKKTIAEINANKWYQEEKEAMKKLNIAAIMKDGEGEYDPNYEVQMPDVFRKKA